MIGDVWIETDLLLANGERAALSGSHPIEVIEGDAVDWPKLEEKLKYYEKESHSVFPTGAAVGYVTYQGEFWFGIYPKLEVVSADNGPVLEEFFSVKNLVCSLNDIEFGKRVGRIHRYIRAGDIYQVNLTRMFTGDFNGSTVTLFHRLKRFSPAPFSAYLECGNKTILSASPELFLRFSGKQITTRPIKGTRPRFRDMLTDQQSAFDLIRNPKELAELIMITDLERNDLGKVCEYGSVEVTELVGRKSFSHVHHLMSTVTGWLRPNISQTQAFRACFPGGSITGAPKARAMEIITELEPHERGLYTGAIGYFGFNGESQFSIAIRTIEINSGKLRLGVGSGITADSEPLAEFKETEYKISGIMAALQMPAAQSVIVNS